MDALLYALYGGTLETPPWQRFLDQLRDLLGGNYATLLLRPPNEHDPGVILNALVVSPEIYHAYNETYFALDPFVNLPDGEVVTVAEYVSSAEFEASEYYRNYIQPANVRHILGADLWDGNRLLARLRVTRPASRDDFGEREKQLCKSVLRHIKQAVEIYSRLRESESERAFYADTIDSLSVGVLTLDAEGRVIQGNPIAARLLEQHSVQSSLGQRLKFSDAREQQAFRELLAEVIDAAEADRIGLVNRVVPEGDLDAHVDDVVERLAAGPPLALSMSKALLDNGLNTSMSQALEAEGQAQSVNFGTRDVREAGAAWMEKREARFEGR